MKEKLIKLLPQKMSKGEYAEKLGISVAQVKELLKEIKEDKIQYGEYQRVNVDSGTLESQKRSSFEPKDHKELAKLHKVDLDKYKIATYYSKQSGSNNFTSTILCSLRKMDNDPKKQKELLLKELKAELPIFPNIKVQAGKKYAYEINIPDHHFGKMAWDEESGANYDLKIAEQRYAAAIAELLSFVNLDDVERIIFPIGNDMINIDSRKNETFAGTKQDSDSRFFKIVRTVKEILIKSINSLSLIAPVDVIVVAGNHDPESMFMIGEILDAYYTSNKNVNVDNSPKQRKYYQYGLNGFQYTHGNEENHKDLGLIFATEESKLWGDTKFRFAKLGHFHKNKKLNYVSLDEYQGFQVQVLPSLSSNDAWHSSKGYNSMRQAKGFLYDKKKGQVAEYTHTL